MATIDDACNFALSKVFQYEPRISKQVIEIMGGASCLFSLDRDSLIEAIGPYSKYRERILSVNPEKELEELQELEKKGFRYLSVSNPAFPSSLTDCEDCPAGFFIRSGDSDGNIFSNEMISIVGTRDMSSYGQEWSTRIVDCLALSDHRPTIVSGLAFGIDITSHNAALERTLPTIAVLGTPIDTVYPWQNERQAEMMAESPGCAVISEYPPGANVTAVNFLCRNRIIAGLSRATVLVESRLKGGGMSTARMAFSYDRSVFAVPGRNDDLRSQGCNSLIHAHIAEPIVSCEEFLSSLQYKRIRTSEKHNIEDECRQFYSGNLDSFRIGSICRILRAVKENRDIGIDGIANISGLPLKDVSAYIVRLENDGFVSTDLMGRCNLRK